jgi:hypothetical protein
MLPSHLCWRNRVAQHPARHSARTLSYCRVLYTTVHCRLSRPQDTHSRVTKLPRHPPHVHHKAHSHRLYIYFAHPVLCYSHALVRHILSMNTRIRHNSVPRSRPTSRRGSMSQAQRNTIELPKAFADDLAGTNLDPQLPYYRLLQLPRPCALHTLFAYSCLDCNSATRILSPCCGIPPPPCALSTLTRNFLQDTRTTITESAKRTMLGINGLG